MPKLKTFPFNCPNCNTAYRGAYVEAAADASKREAKCVSCDNLLPRRQGRFVLEYFAVSESGKRSRRSL
jgi:hypothetical protein